MKVGAWLAKRRAPTRIARFCASAGAASAVAAVAPMRPSVRRRVMVMAKSSQRSRGRRGEGSRPVNRRGGAEIQVASGSGASRSRAEHLVQGGAGPARTACGGARLLSGGRTGDPRFARSTLARRRRAPPRRVRATRHPARRPSAGPRPDRCSRRAGDPLRGPRSKLTTFSGRPSGRAPVGAPHVRSSKGPPDLSPATPDRCSLRDGDPLARAAFDTGDVPPEGRRRSRGFARATPVRACKRPTGAFAGGAHPAARDWRLRSWGSRKRLRRRIDFGVTSTSSSLSM